MTVSVDGAPVYVTADHEVPLILTVTDNLPRTGRYVTLSRADPTPELTNYYINVCEVQVLGTHMYWPTEMDLIKKRKREEGE